MKWTILVVLELYAISAVRGLSREEAICYEPSSYGNCTGTISVWHYEVMDHSCRRMVYSGCGGNENKFHTWEECKEACMETVGTKSTGSVSSTTKHYSTRKVRTTREEVTETTRKKPGIIHHLNKTMECNENGKFKRGRRRNARIKGRQTPVDGEKNARGSLANTRNDQIVKYNRVRGRFVNYRANQRGNRTKNAWNESRNKNNYYRQQHSGTGRIRCTNKKRNEYLRSRKKNTATENNSVTEPNDERK